MHNALYLFIDWLDLNLIFDLNVQETSVVDMSESSAKKCKEIFLASAKSVKFFWLLIQKIT